MNLLSAGHAHPDVMPHLCGTTLLPCQKKGGGLPPIAVGEVLRRLTSEWLSHSVLAEAFQTLTPLQMGVGVKGGCKAIVHSVSRTAEDTSIPQTIAGHMFKEVRSCIPSLATWMEEALP